MLVGWVGGRGWVKRENGRGAEGGSVWLGLDELEADRSGIDFGKINEEEKIGEEEMKAPAGIF